MRSLPELAAARDELTAAGRGVGFVPTMGALHEGHLSLIRLASAHADATAVSIFVNPLQFGPGEDLGRYPRPLEDDVAACRAAGVDLVFVPSEADLYPPGRSVTVSAGPLGDRWEGRSRPGHFDGVLTVVLKLLHLVRPRAAVFGEKDAQQLACIRRMVLDLNLDVDLVSGPIVRDPDGLAISSRNRYLSPQERADARALPAALHAAAAEQTADQAQAAARTVLAARPGLKVDYAAVVDPATFEEVAPDYAGVARLILAARVGTTRLIDNATLVVAPAPATSVGA